MDNESDFSMNQLDFERSAKPLYVQIEELVYNYIKQRKLQKGDALPPMGEIAEKFGVNRITVRQAIKNLTAKGIVTSHRGKGTFVAVDYEQYPLLVIKTKLTQHMAFTTGASVELLSSKKGNVRDYSFIPKSERYESYQHFVHRNSKSGRPIGFLNIFVASHVFDQAPDKFQKQLVVRAIVAFLGKENIARIHQRMTIGVATSEDANHLAIQKGSPVVNIHRYILDTSNKTVSAALIVYPVDIIEFHMDMDVDLD